MIRLLRHERSVPGEDDGAARFDDLMNEFEAKFDGSSQWSHKDGYLIWRKVEDPRKYFNVA